MRNGGITWSVFEVFSTDDMSNIKVRAPVVSQYQQLSHLYLEKWSNILPRSQLVCASLSIKRFRLHSAIESSKIQTHFKGQQSYELEDAQRNQRRV